MTNTNNIDLFLCYLLGLLKKVCMVVCALCMYVNVYVWCIFVHVCWWYVCVVCVICVWCVYVCVFVHFSFHACICGGQRLTLDVFITLLLLPLLLLL